MRIKANPQAVGKYGVLTSERAKERVTMVGSKQVRNDYEN